MSSTSTRAGQRLEAYLAAMALRVRPPLGKKPGGAPAGGRPSRPGSCSWKNRLRHRLTTSRPMANTVRPPWRNDGTQGYARNRGYADQQQGSSTFTSRRLEIDSRSPRVVASPKRESFHSLDKRTLLLNFIVDAVKPHIIQRSLALTHCDFHYVLSDRLAGGIASIAE
jgi:hypothetical protein